MSNNALLKDKLLGGLYGLLIGDAVGMPYEFKRANMLPPYDKIDIVAPDDFNRSWKEIPFGSYTDDGSQALCLLEYYTEKQPGDDWAQAWANKLQRWYFSAHLWVDNRSFDAGVQTREVMAKLQNGVPPLEAARPDDPWLNGNGSLMRALPTALWNAFHMPMADILYEAEDISRITHAHARARYCCAFYNAIAVIMLHGESFNSAFDMAMDYMCHPDRFDQGEWSIVLEGERQEQKGSGYVVDSMWSALMCIRNTTNYKDCIKLAISLGNDTDTTACIAGGLAGIKYGLSGIPKDWYDRLRGKELVTPLAQKLLERHGVM